MRTWTWIATLLWACAACTPNDGPSTRGNPCAADRECDSLHCVADADATPDDLAAEPLVCGDVGEGGGPGASCERGDQCQYGVCALAGACVQPCADASDCDASARCQDVLARRGDDALTKLRACTPRTSLPEHVDVSSETLDGVLGEPAEVELGAVEADATNLIVLEHESPTWPDTVLCRPPLCITALHGTAGRVLFDADACEEAPIVPIATGDHIDPAVIRLAGDAAGEDGYTVSLDSEAPGDLRITRIASRGERRQLDLNVFYVGARDLASEGERGPALVSEALDVVDSIFAQADIVVGDVRQIAVPGMLPERGLAFEDGDQGQGFASLALRFGVYVELPYLFRLSAGATNPAVNLFFVRDIENNGQGDVEAESGGIPGPLGMHGTGGSGIVIAADMMAGDSQSLGRTLAHELAHYLGLFHTSEGNGCVREALADTPECRAEDDVAGDGLDVQDCQGHGADNLMFWAKVEGTTLTPEQISVLRSAPILH